MTDLQMNKIKIVNYLLLILIILGISLIVWKGYLNMVKGVIADKLLSGAGAVQFEYAIGESDSRTDNRLSEPMGVAIADNGDIYVADTLDSVVKIFGSKGNFKSSFGGKNLFYLPSDIVVDKDNVYVVDQKNFRIQLFDSNGKFKRTFVGGEIGKKIGAWIPSAMCIGPKGQVYATDVFYHRVIVFDQKGQIITHFGTPGTGPGQLSYPNGIAVDQMGNVFVADSNNGRVQVFDAQGKFINTLNKGALAFTMPRGMTFADKNTLFVTETFAHRLLSLEVNKDVATNLTTIGTRGTGDGEMNFPNDVSIKDNTLAVADRANNRVLVYSLNE